MQICEECGGLEEEEKANLLFKCCAILLQRHEGGVQGLAIAQLTAMWLAGYFGPEGLREELLQYHISGVRKMIPEYESMILQVIKERGSH